MRPDVSCIDLRDLVATSYGTRRDGFTVERRNTHSHLKRTGSTLVHSRILDFVHDRLRTNRRFRILGVGDDCSRRNLALEADFALSGDRMTRVLDDIALVRGYPKIVVLDNGPEMRSLAMLTWARDHGVRLHFIEPGKPVQNAFIESFNGRLATSV